MTALAAPKFKVLDIVELRPPGAYDGCRVAITQVREYAGPRYQYSVSGVTGIEEVDDEISGRFDEEDLRSTGERAPVEFSAELFALPGGFRVGEIVVVHADHGDPDVAGRTGAIDGTCNGYGQVGVQFFDSDDCVLVQPWVLAATGERLPQPQPQYPRTVHSTQVSVNGQITGHSAYQILDEISRYLK